MLDLQSLHLWLVVSSSQVHPGGHRKWARYCKWEKQRCRSFMIISYHLISLNAFQYLLHHTNATYCDFSYAFMMLHYCRWGHWTTQINMSDLCRGTTNVRCDRRKQTGFGDPEDTRHRTLTKNYEKVGSSGAKTTVCTAALWPWKVAKTSPVLSTEGNWEVNPSKSVPQRLKHNQTSSNHKGWPSLTIQYKYKRRMTWEASFLSSHERKRKRKAWYASLVVEMNPIWIQGLVLINWSPDNSKTTATCMQPGRLCVVLDKNAIGSGSSKTPSRLWTSVKMANGRQFNIIQIHSISDFAWFLKLYHHLTDSKFAKYNMSNPGWLCKGILQSKQTQTTATKSSTMIIYDHLWSAMFVYVALTNVTLWLYRVHLVRMASRPEQMRLNARRAQMHLGAPRLASNGHPVHGSKLTRADQMFSLLGHLSFSGTFAGTHHQWFLRPGCRSIKCQQQPSRMMQDVAQSAPASSSTSPWNRQRQTAALCRLATDVSGPQLLNALPVVLSCHPGALSKDPKGRKKSQVL